MGRAPCAQRGPGLGHWLASQRAQQLGYYGGSSPEMIEDEQDDLFAARAESARRLLTSVTEGGVA